MHIHEKWIDGKRYLDEIRACDCVKKIGDEYEVECRIHQRGTQWYYTGKKAETIVRDGTKIWYLTEEAKRPVKNAIRRFESGVARIESKDPFKAEFGETGVFVSFVRRSKRSFEAVLRDPVRKSPVVLPIKKGSIGSIIKETAHYFFSDLRKDRDLWDLLLYGSAETLPENPFYKEALTREDEDLARQIRLFYNLATEEDIRGIAKLLRRRVLPSLGKEYDQFYTVPLKEIDFGLLYRSGYQFCHRPYFSMRPGMTHTLCELNPHTKRGVDAGNEEIEPTSFKDYLALFRKGEKA